MAWIQDPARVRGRQQARDLLAMSRNTLSIIADACADLATEVRAAVGGTRLGGGMEKSLLDAAARLEQACSRSQDDARSASEISVDVWVPDPEPTEWKD